MERSLELRVGAVLLLALLVLGGFVLLLGDVGFQRGIRISVGYVFSGPIQPGAPVKVSGVKVGRVERIEFLGGVADPNGDPIQVKLILFIEDRARTALRQGARFYINTQGLLGEHYVELVPALHPGAPLEDGAEVRGEDPPRFDLLVQRIYELLDAASNLLERDQGELADLIRSGASLAKGLDGAIKENKDQLRRTIVAAADTSEEARRLLASVNGAIGDGGKLGRTLDDVSVSTALVRKELPGAVEKLQHALDQARKLGETIDRIPPAEVERLVRHAASAAENADRTLAEARVISERVRSGGGTVGLLLADDEIYDDLKDLLRDLKQHPWKLVWKQ